MSRSLAWPACRLRGNAPAAWYSALRKSTADTLHGLLATGLRVETGFFLKLGVFLAPSRLLQTLRGGRLSLQETDACGKRQQTHAGNSQPAMLNDLRRKIRGLFMDPGPNPSIRCFGSDIHGTARSAFLVAVLANDEMSEVFGKITCRFDKISLTLTVAEAHLVERWRHLWVFQDMLAAAVEKCAARDVVVNDPANESYWTKLLGHDVAGARVRGASRAREAAATPDGRCLPQ